MILYCHPRKESEKEMPRVWSFSRNLPWTSAPSITASGAFQRQHFLPNLTRAPHSRISLAHLTRANEDLSCRDDWGSPESGPGTGMHQLVISDHKGGGFSLDSYSVHYKVFILLEYYVCLYLELFQRYKIIPLSFQKIPGNGVFFTIQRLHFFMQWFFYVGVISRLG